MSRFVSGGETTGKVLRRMVVWGAGVGCGGAGRRTEKLERTEESKTIGIGGGRFRVQRSNDNETVCK